MSRYVRFFEEFGMGDVSLAWEARMPRWARCTESSRAMAVRIPHGFATTAEAYGHMLQQAGAVEPLRAALHGLDAVDVADLARRGKRAREIVYGAGLPDDLAGEILAGYRRLQQEYGEEVSLAVRSSATAEDLPTASFAGQQESYSERARRSEPARGMPPLLCESVHRPRDPLPDRPGVRSLQGGTLDRRDEDGALGPCIVWRVLVARHRIGFPRGGAGHRGVRAGRKRRAGRCRPRRVLRPQADL